MPRKPMPAEWKKLAHLFDEINESFIDYQEQASFLLTCRDRLCPDAALALDLGCATGQHAWRLAEAGLQVVGLDLSPALLLRGKKLRRKAAPPHFVCGDMTALPLGARFDLIYALNFVVSFLHTNVALRSALAEIRRVLAPHGLFVMDYHFFFPQTAADPLASTWRERCRVRGQTLTVTHRPLVDWRTQLSTDRMTYRFREGRRLVRELESTEVRRISLPQDLRLILELAGFEVLHHCARFDLDKQPGGGLGVIVGKRRQDRKLRP